MIMMSASPDRFAHAAGQPHAGRLAEVFRLLSDKTRLSLLLILSRGERNVTSLCQELELPQPTVSHHLGLLRSGGLLVCRRSGKQIYYQLGAGTEPESDSLLALRVDGMNIRVGDELGRSQP